MAKQKEKEKPKFNIGEDWEVVHVRDTKAGIFFTLQLPGLSLYNLRYVPAGKSKNGKRYNDFIAMPSQKGSDGNYYDAYRLWLSEDDISTIVAAVAEELEG